MRMLFNIIKNLKLIKLLVFSSPNMGMIITLYSDYLSFYKDFFFTKNLGLIHDLNANLFDNKYFTLFQLYDIYIDHMASKNLIYENSLIPQSVSSCFTRGIQMNLVRPLI